MIVVEGTDLVGKTSLCKRLAVVLGARGWPVVQRSFGLLPPQWDYYHDYLPSIDRMVVMDRFHLSELAYARAARGGKTRLGVQTFRLLEARLTLVGAVRVLVLGEKDTLCHFHRLRGDETYSLDTIYAADAAFRQLETELEWADVVHLTYTTSQMPSSSDALVTQIVTEWEERQNHINTLAARGRVPWT